MHVRLDLEQKARNRDYSLAMDQAHAPSIQRLAEMALGTLNGPHAFTQSDRYAVWVAKLGEAVLAPNEDAHKSVVRALLDRGVSTFDLFQCYIPDAARYIGAKWVSDEVSFVAVTTGTARLQALFRDSPEEPDPCLTRAGGMIDDPVLMVIPTFEHHSLGAFVASSFLRRKGVCTRMAIGPSEAELEKLLLTTPFRLIGLTIATEKSLELAAGLIERLRSRLDHVPPIMVGGLITNSHAAIPQCTKADYAVNTPDQALRLCNQYAGTRPRDFELAE